MRRARIQTGRPTSLDGREPGSRPIWIHRFRPWNRASWNRLRDYFDEETSHVIPALIKKTLNMREVPIWGSGNQTRVFVHARDLARGLIRVAEVDECFEQEAINIGHDQEISIRDLYFLICKLLGKHPNPRFDLTQPEGYPRRAADFSLLKRLTGFECTTGLEKGLQETIDWYLSL